MQALPAAGTTSSSDPGVLVDALPYIDTGYDEAARQAAIAMIEDECRRFRPTKNYLAHLPTPKYDAFMTEVMKNEYERIQNGQPMDLLNMKRYELPGPPAGKQTDITAWQDAVDNSKAQLEHLDVRRVNLELLTEYGPEAYKSYNEVLQKTMNTAEKELLAAKSKILDIHSERKRNQTGAGEKLKALEASWVGLISKNFQIEKACAELAVDMEPLRKKLKNQGVLS